GGFNGAAYSSSGVYAWESVEEIFSSPGVHAWEEEIFIGPPSGVCRKNPVGMRCLWKGTKLDARSPFMGERYSVSLLKELPDINSVWCSINISPLRGFFDSLLKEAGRNQFYFRYPRVNAWARENSTVRMTLIKICGITNL